MPIMSTNTHLAVCVYPIHLSGVILSQDSRHDILSRPVQRSAERSVSVYTYSARCCAIYLHRTSSQLSTVCPSPR